MATTTNHRPGGLTKMEGVRRALAELGPDAKPLAIKGYLRSRFRLDISADVASNYKKLLAKRARSAKQPPAAVPPPATVVRLTPTATVAKPSGDAIRLEDLQALKGLMGRVGSDHLRTLIDLLAR